MKKSEKMDKYCKYLKIKLRNFESGKTNYLIFLMDVFDDTQYLLNKFGLEKPNQKNINMRGSNEE